jgi:hypothetical protein
VTRKQYADIKPPIHEIKDPMYEERKHEYESDQRVSREELSAAAARPDVPLAVSELNTQDFL